MTNASSGRYDSKPEAHDERRTATLSDEAAPGAKDTASVFDASGGAVWDAHAEHEIGVLIERYLTEHPAPDGATCAEPFARWAGELHRSGQARLEALGEQRLRAV